MSIFYDHLTNLQTVRPQLVLLLHSEEEVEMVLQELDAALHHDVLRIILNALPEYLHESFIVSFKEDPGSHRHLLLLRQYAPDIDERIRAASEESKKLFLDAIHE